MTEDQIPLMAFLAFVGGMFAGLWVWRRRSVTIAILIAVVLLDAIGWATYGFIVNWQPHWGIPQIVGGLLYAGIGLLIFTGLPAIFGCFVAAGAICLWKRSKLTP